MRNEEEAKIMSLGDRGRPCPYCSTGELDRVHTAWWLRALRMIPGLHPRSYRCDGCSKTVTRWRDS
jgi:hypothetical protein